MTGVTPNPLPTPLISRGYDRGLKCEINEDGQFMISAAGGATVTLPRPVAIATLRRRVDAAEVYALALGEGTDPILAVASRLGISSDQGRSLVAQARALGLLTPTSPGTPGGNLTDTAFRARELLNATAE